MRLLSKRFPYSWEMDGKKYIIKEDLLSEAKDRIIMENFYKNILNTWEDTVKYLGEETIDDIIYFVFSYDSSLIMLNDLEVFPRKIKALKLTLDNIYANSLATKFESQGKFYCIIPLDNSLDNFMYSYSNEKFIMIDVDSFYITELEELELIYIMLFDKLGSINLINL